MEAAEAVAAIEGNLERFLFNFCRLPETRVYHSPEVTQLVAEVPVGMFNLVLRSRLPAEGLAAAVAEVTSRFAALSVPACWWITPSSRPEHLAHHLLGSGWSGASGWRGMAMELTATSPSPSPPERVRVSVVREPEALRQWVRVFQRGFGASGQVGELLLRAWEGAELPFTLLLAHQDAAPVATALLQKSGSAFLTGHGSVAPSIRTHAPGLFHESTRSGGSHPPARSRAPVSSRPSGATDRHLASTEPPWLPQETGEVAGIYCVTTLPEARRRGIGRHITAAALETARAQGCTRAIVQSTEMGRGLYRRLGFGEYCRIRMLERG